jgi:hypothetical protein
VGLNTINLVAIHAANMPANYLNRSKRNKKARRFLCGLFVFEALRLVNSAPQITAQCPKRFSDA